MSCPYCRDAVLIGTVHIGDGIGTLHPFPLQAFPVQHHGEVAECLLLCLLLCESGLFQVHGRDSVHGSGFGPGTSEAAACLPLHRRHDGGQVRETVRGRVKALRPCGTQWL